MATFVRVMTSARGVRQGDDSTTQSRVGTSGWYQVNAVAAGGVVGRLVQSLLLRGGILLGGRLKG